jgi:hypothetical protein
LKGKSSIAELLEQQFMTLSRKGEKYAMVVGLIADIDRLFTDDEVRVFSEEAEAVVA